VSTSDTDTVTDWSQVVNCNSTNGAAEAATTSTKATEATTASAAAPKATTASTGEAAATREAAATKPKEFARVIVEFVAAEVVGDRNSRDGEQKYCRPFHCL